MEKVTRDILGQTFNATVDAKTTGKILAIANFVDKQIEEKIETLA